MRIELHGPLARLTLDRDELRLLRFALERASFIDTPTAEQPNIATFCSRALELLPRLERGTQETARGSGGDSHRDARHEPPNRSQDAERDVPSTHR